MIDLDACSPLVPPDAAGLLSAIDSCIRGGGRAGPYLDGLDDEISRAECQISRGEEMVVKLARSLLADTERGGGGCIGGSHGGGVVEDARAHRRRAEGVARAAAGLGTYTSECAEIFRKVAGTADAKLGIESSRHVERRLDGPPWSSAEVGGEVIALLSDIYSNVRAAEGQGVSADRWVAPSSFERKTHKYWISDGRLIEVMVAAVAQVPVLVYGQTGPISSKGSGSWEDGLSTPVNSVYFDSESFPLYRERLARTEGARLLRVRWYGHSVPSGDETLFLELKTHHESWVNVKSVKRRVAIQERDMSLLLQSGGGWTKSYAKNVVLRASPGLRGEKLDEATGLMLDCRGLVVEHRLRPTVGTRYLRAAFQSPKSNDLRLTVDRSIVVTDESGAPPGGWRVPGDVQSRGGGGSARVPCPVFEVKVNGEDMPPFVRRLLDSGAILDGHKFSKCLTGVATFRANEVGKLPYWAELPLFRSMFGGTGNARVSEPLGARELARKNTESTQANEEEFTNQAEMFANEGGPSEDPSDTRGLVALLGLRMRRDKQKPISSARPVKVEPKSYFANERTFIQWISAALLMVTVAAILMDFGNRSATTTSLVLFILAMVVVSYALAVYYRRIYLMQHRKTYGYVDFIGPAFLTLTILIGMGSILYFHFKAPETASPDSPFVRSQRNPLSQESGLCDCLSIDGVSVMDYQPSDAVADTGRGLLLVPSVSSITALPLDPALGRGARTVAEIPGGDLEALTYVEDILYAVSEQRKQSELFAFQWSWDKDALDEKLKVVGRWQIDAPLVESMAFIPSGTNYAGKLIVGNGKGLEVYSVSLPSYGDTNIPGPLMYPVRTINRKLICQGLGDNCKVGSMQFFEGLLYMLHDNDRVIRSWDLEAGKKVAEYTLPWVDEGYDKQWEGMALVRAEPDGGMMSGLRKQTLPVSSLRLYLTLDTPPQVWSIAINEKRSGWDVPECAAGSFLQQ